MPAANQTFLWAKVPLAEGRVLGERSCFWPEAPDNTGLGPGGPNSGLMAVLATTRVVVEGPHSIGHVGDCYSEVILIYRGGA